MARDYTPEEVDTFVSEFIGRAKQYKETRKAWESAMDAQKLAATAYDPTQLTDVYANDPTKAPERVIADAAVQAFGSLVPGLNLNEEKLGEMGAQVLGARRSEFTAAAEGAWQSNREEISLEWWLQFTPSDIRLFGGNTEEANELAGHLEEVQQHIADEERFQRDVDRATDVAWEARQNRGVFGWARDRLGELVGEGMTGRPSGGGDSADRIEYNQLRRETEEQLLDPSKTFDDRIDVYMEDFRKSYIESHEERVHMEGRKVVVDQEARTIDGRLMEASMEAEEARIRQLLSAQGDPGDILEDKSLLARGVDGVIGVIPWTIDKADRGLEGVLWGLEGMTPGHGTYDTMRAEYEQEQLALKAEMDTMSGKPDDELMRAAAYRPLKDAWAAMPQENPEQHQTYMLMAGMDPTVAFGLFSADVSEDPEAREQMMNVVEELKAQERQSIEDFEAADFRVSGKLLDIMASYGRNVPGRLSTYASLFFTDGDYFDDAIHGRWGEFFTEIERESEYFGHTPSAAIGIDGSLSGLLLDLGAGIAFDPFTWIFGPRASVRSAKASSMATAERVAAHPITQQFVRDAARVARSPSKGMAELLHISSWADSRFIGEVLDIVGFRTKQLPASNWRATRGAENAMEVETQFLSALVDDEARLAAGAVDDLGDNILAKGFEEYISITISRGDGVVFVDDGFKRILAAEKAGISHVPTRLRIVDDFAGRPTNLSGTATNRGVVEGLVRNGDSLRKKMSQKVGKEKLSSDPSIVGRHKLSDGSELVIRSSGSVKKPAFFAYVNDTAKQTTRTVGGFYGDEIGLLKKYSASKGDDAIVLADDGRSIAQTVIDTAEQAGATPLERLAASQSITDAGYSFLQKEALRLGKTLEFETFKGISLDVFMKGKQSRRALKGLGAGDLYTRPDQFFRREMLLGRLDEAALDAATKRAIMRGNVPDGAHRGAISRAWNQTIRQAARNNKGTKWVERYLSQQNTVRRIELIGSRAMDRIYDTTFRIWGDDLVKVDHWQTRFMEFQRRAQSSQRNAMEQLQALTPMRHELDRMLDEIGGSPYKAARTMKGPKGVALRKEYKALQKKYDDLQKTFDEQYAAIDKDLAAHADPNELGKLVEEMWEDYNRQYIASNPAWASKVDDTGMVPWEELKRGSLFKKTDDLPYEGAREFIPENMKQIAEEMGVDAEKLVQRLSNTLDSRTAVNVPMSPLELTLAREVGGAAYTRLSQRVYAAAARDAAHGMNNMWKIDKVFRPATAITVSMDELQRIWHIGGMRAFLRWQGDRALFLRARAQTLLSLKNPLSRAAVRRGVTKLSAKSQKRVQALSDYPTHLKAAERQLHDGNGLGYKDIMPNEGQYLEAAQRWTGGLLQDSGFRAFLRGPEAFKEWFFSPDGSRMRQGVALAKSEGGGIHTRLVAGADEAYSGWKSLFEDVILKTSKDDGVFDDILTHFKETAAKIDEAGGRPMELPSQVFDHLGPVRGVKKDLGMKHPVAGMTESFFDSFFMDPVNYRRGFLAEQVRAAETARLKRLFASQNKQIVPDIELERLLGLKGMGGGTRTGLKDVIYDAAIDKGFIPQGYIDDVVESAVEREIDNVLYTWDRGSRLGAQSQALFPFGKPWADMAGFWGKEMMRKPMLRGVINDTNFLGMRTMYNKMPMPFNPKPVAMMSRLAHTDFTIDKGLHPSLPGQFGEGGVLPGADQTDFSPLLFLPTGGDNPFGAILPGIGYVPMWALDMFIQNKYDPVDEPEEYQRLIEQIADFVPAVGYSAGTGIIPRVLGGGTIGTATSLVIDGATFVNHEPYFFATNMLGDISRELDRTRELSALLADPEEFMELLSAENPADVETLLLALSHEADNRVAGSHAMETITRWIIPASNQYETAVHEIFDVWIDAAGTFPELAVRPDLANADMDDPDIRRQYSNDVRKAFYELPTWQRDLFVAQQPSLAVNLVGSWDWTPSAKQAGIEGTDTVYRSGGTKDDLARHQAYVDSGYIRPVVPIERAKRIIGLMQGAKENAAKTIYESQASAVNNVLWTQVVSDDTRALLDRVLKSGFADEWALTTAQDLWSNWSQMEQRIEEYVAEKSGVEPIKGNADYEAIRAGVFIPADEKPWGKNWPGLDDDELSARFRQVTFNQFTDETMAIANGLGIDLTKGMTGLELFAEVQAVITEVDSPLYSTVRPAYDHYMGDKGVGARSSDSELAKAKTNPDLHEDWRDKLSNWMVRADRIGDQYRDVVGGVPLREAREMAEEYGRLVQTSGLNIPWDDIWKYKYERTYGPLEWEAPEPLTPLDDGVKRPGTVVPHIKYITDGDSFVFQERQGAQELRTVRLIGVNARDYGMDDNGAAADKRRLQDALQRAVDEDATIYLVRDPLFGDTDHYGRMLAWLWIGDEPFYFEEEVRSTQTPSGGES